MLVKKKCIENQLRVTLGAGRLSKQYHVVQRTAGSKKVSKSARMFDSNALLLSMKLEKSTRISACEAASTIRRRNFYEENGTFRNTLQTG